MKSLPNSRREVFAIARFEGATLRQAMARAGYAWNAGNAHRLNKNEEIQSRIAELKADASKAVTDRAGYDARTLFDRIRRVSDAALEAEDFKVAADCEKFIATCFGYEDSPTLTHEHVGGRKLESDPAPTNVVPMPAPRFAHLVARMRAKLDSPQ